MPDFGSPGVLVVDDQADMRALLQTVLRHFGFKVRLAPNGPAALDMFRDHRNDIAIVLLDVVMPEWDGPRTWREIRALEPMAICCFITGESVGTSTDDLIALGAAHVIRKPFEPAALAKSLWSLVGPRDRRADRPRYTRQSTRVRVGAGLEPAHVVESWVGDTSPGGLRLKLPEKLGDVGSILSIRPADATDEVPWIPIQVRHGREEHDGWTVGCQILHPAAMEL
ncbi:MAG: response regulator [Gemmataceae bacterium]